MIKLTDFEERAKETKRRNMSAEDKLIWIMDQIDKLRGDIQQVKTAQRASKKREKEMADNVPEDIPF